MTLRPIGASMPLGFFGLAVGTLTYAGLQLGWIDSGERLLVGVLLVAAPVPLQLIGSIFAFLARDGAAAGGLGLLAVTWLGIGLVLILSAPGSTSGALGLLLLVSGAGLVATASATALSKVVPALVLLVAGARFLLGGIYELGGGEGWQDASAAAGLVLAALALYAAWALELGDARSSTLLPLGRRGSGERSLEGALADQLRGVEHEAGVRRRL